MRILSVLITVGTRPNYTGDWSTSLTTISRINPANASGIIDEVDVEVGSGGVSGLVIATFRLVSGTTYICKSRIVIGTLSQGVNYLTGLSLSITAGDYIGCYYSGGYLRHNNTGTNGTYYVSGNYSNVDDSTSYTSYFSYLCLLGRGFS